MLLQSSNRFANHSGGEQVHSPNLQALIVMDKQDTAHSRPPLLDSRYELLGHISIGVSSYENAKIFYDEVMQALGAARVYDNPEGRILS